jgi:CheY-like chemotaxis protein
MPQGGTLRVRAAPAGPRPGGRDPATSVPGVSYVSVTVEDTGTGMDAPTLARAFEPFFTTKAPGAGAGLGLSSVYGLMQQQQGEVELESTLGAGTTVRLLFPASLDGETSPQPRGASATSPAGAEAVLLVDDMEPMRRAAQRVLTRLGYTVLLATSGEEGLAVFRANPGGIALVVTDVVMPGLDGEGLYRAIRSEGSLVPFVFMSGYPASEISGGRPLDPSVPFLRKPFTPDALAHCVGEALAREGTLVAVGPRGGSGSRTQG